jgi:hypothetical protein
MLAQYLRTDDFRQQVQERADAVNLALHTELFSHTKTGILEGSTDVHVEYFDSGYGLKGNSLFRAFFVANNEGFTRNRTSFRRGVGMRHKKNWKATTPTRKASYPSVVRTALNVFNPEG